jgi:hypothetical protein
MADNYLQFSEVLVNLTEPEEAWLKEQLQTIRVFNDKEYAEDAIPAELTSANTDWAGVRFLHDKDDFDSRWDTLGFEYEFDSDSDKDGWGRHFWLHADDWGNPENVAYLVQKFLKMFRPDQCWSLTYAASCSKPRIGEFEGGAVFVTADAIRHQNAFGFIEEQRAKFETTKTTTPFGEISHECK